MGTSVISSAAPRGTGATRTKGTVYVQLPAPTAGRGRRDVAFLLSVGALCAAAWLLRCFWLGRQSLWYDEAGSVALARMPIGQIFGAAQLDIHPPLYFYLLHAWLSLAGTSEEALRLLSAGLSTLLVPVLAVLGRRAGGRATGLVAGALAAINPFFVYYGQETRMYALLALLSAVAFYALVRASEGQRRWWAVFAGAASLALWTHLYGALTLLAADVWLGLSQVLPRVVEECRSRRRGRSLRDEREPQAATTVDRGGWRVAATCLALANVAVVAAYLPWLPTALAKMGTYTSPDKGSSLGWILDQTLVVFGLGHSVVGVTSFPGTPEFAAQDALAHRLIAPFLVCLVVGAAVAARGRASFALSWLAVPVMGGALVSMGKRDLNVRYLIEAAPAFVLLVGMAIAWLLAKRRARVLGVLALLCVAGASAASLHAMYTDPAYARDDDRRAVAIIRERAVPGAGVVLDANFSPVFDYYARGGWPAINEPRDVPPDAEATAHDLADFVAGRPQVWAILWHDYYADPRGIVWGWLKQHLYARDYVNVRGGLKVLQFDAKPPGVAPSGAVFGGVAMVEAYVSHLVPSAPSGPATVDLYWRALGQPNADYSIAAHLIDPAGHVYGSSDEQPAGGHLPMTSWHAGDLVHTVQPLQLEPWTAPGDYRLQVVVYDQASAKALRAAGPGAEDSGLMLPVTVAASDSADDRGAATPLPAGATEVNATFGTFAALRGYQLDRSPDGGTLTLFWRALGPAPLSYKVFVHALDGAGNVVATGDSNPVSGASDMTAWRAGECIRDVHDIARAASTPRSIEVGLYDPASGARVDVRGSDGTSPPDRALRLPST